MGATESLGQAMDIMRRIIQCTQCRSAKVM